METLPQRRGWRSELNSEENALPSVGRGQKQQTIGKEGTRKLIQRYSRDRKRVIRVTVVACSVHCRLPRASHTAMLLLGPFRVPEKLARNLYEECQQGRHYLLAALHFASTTSSQHDSAASVFSWVFSNRTQSN